MKALTLLRKRPLYARLVAAQFVSVFGDKFTYVAMQMLAYSMSGGQALPVGIVLLANLALPAIVGMVAGPLVDRWHRGWTLVGSDLFRAVVIALAFFADSLGELYALSFLLGVGTVFATPAWLAALPATVEEDELNTANTFANWAESLMWFIGPAAASLTLTWVDARTAFLVDSVTFLVSAALLLPLTRHLPAVAHPEGEPQRSRLLDDLRDGLLYHLENGVVANLLLLQTTLVVAGYGLNALLEVITVEHLHGREEQLGLVSSAMAAGLALGYLILSQLGSRIDRRQVIGWSYACAGLAVWAILRVPDLWTALPAFFLVGLFNAGFSGTQPAWIQEVVPSHLLGRVFALRYAAINVAGGLGMPLAGWLSDTVSLPATLFLCGMVMIGCGVMTFLLPGLRAAQRSVAAPS